jgi:hypothetical protein
MAKMTIDALKTFVATYVASAKQAGAWSASTDNLLKLLDKVGQQITLDGTFADKLPELDGNDLPLGKTIEEWFVDLVLPQTYDATGANALAPSYPSVEDAAYSYNLGRRVIPTTVPYDNVERAALSASDAGAMVAKIIERLTNSYSLYTYQQKKQLLANLITKANAATNKDTLVQTLAIPSDTTTSEAFIKQVKADIESASFANEGHSLNNNLIGAAPSLMLIIKKGVMPTVEVDALAGAFHAENLALPATIKVVDDFGTDSTGVYAMLVDPRGIKLHRGYHAIRENINGAGDFINYFDHSENTGFISKNTFVKVYKAA